MIRSFKSSTSLTPPSYPGASATGYPQEGNPGTGTPATKPGAFWFYMMTEELLNAVVALGQTPNSGSVNQLATGLATLAPLASPAFTGNPTVPTQSAGNNSTRAASTAYVDGALASKAPLASPAFTGNPTVPTQTANDNSTKAASTAYVDGALAAKAPLASPAFTGNPTVPTQSALDNSTKAASTAYVDSLAALKASAVAIFEQTATSGSSGGGVTAGSWQTRPLNTTHRNAIPSCSLSSNQISLPAGNYMVDWLCHTFNVNRNQSRLRNVTDGTTLIVGTNTRSDSNSAGNVPSYGKGYFTLAGTKTIELQHLVETTNATNGYGQDNSITGSTEVAKYSSLTIYKV